MITAEEYLKRANIITREDTLKEIEPTCVKLSKLVQGEVLNRIEPVLEYCLRNQIATQFNFRLDILARIALADKFTLEFFKEALKTQTIAQVLEDNQYRYDTLQNIHNLFSKHMMNDYRQELTVNNQFSDMVCEDVNNAIFVDYDGSKAWATRFYNKLTKRIQQLLTENGYKDIDYSFNTYLLEDKTRMLSLEFNLTK